jgi:hypothetical protein
MVVGGMNTTYQKIDEIADYLNAQRREFPRPMTVGEAITIMSREQLQKKYADLLLLSQQLIQTSSYILGREHE